MTKLTTKFVMPKGYRRIFQLEGETVKATMIFEAPDKVSFDQWEVPSGVNPKETSWTLDWMLECRNDVEKDIVRYKR